MTAAPPTPANPERAELVALLLACAREDEAAFAEVYNRTSAKLFGVIVRICSDPVLAEDILVDVYHTIWRRAGAFEPGRASPITWMATIARNRAIDAVRRLPRQAPLDLSAAAELPDPAEPALAAMLAREQEGRLHLCLDRLDATQSGAIRTAFFQGLSYAELAERLGTPLGTVKSWIRRGLARLKECLHDAD